MPPLPNDCSNQANTGDSKQNRYTIAAKPVFDLTTIKHHFKACKSDHDQTNAERIDLQLPAAASRGDLLLERRRILHYAAAEQRESSPIGTLIKKTQRQLNVSVIHPPRGGPMAGVVTIAML